MPTRLRNLNFFIFQRSLRFYFAAIAHVGDFLVPLLGGAPYSQCNEPVPAAIIRDAAVPALGEKKHLIFEYVRT